MTATTIDDYTEPGPRWFVVMTEPNAERRVEAELAQIGYRTFMPKLKRWVSHARVKRAVEKPLLSRYLFVEVDHPRQSFGAVRSVNGVGGLVGNSVGEPAPAPRAVVENFLRRYLIGEFDYVRSDPVYLLDGTVRVNDRTPLGARCRAMAGEFEDMLVTITGRRRGMIDFKLVGSNRYGRLLERDVRAA